MKTNRIVLVLAVLAIATAGFFATVNSVATAVQVPNEINLFIDSLIFGAVTAGFVFVFKAIGLDLRGLATPVSAALSGYIIGELQNLINTIPATYDAYVTIVFRIIVVVIGGIGTLYLIKKSSGVITANAEVESLL